MKNIKSSLCVNSLYSFKLVHVIIFAVSLFVFAPFASADAGEDLYKKKDWKGALEFYKGIIDSGQGGWEEYYNVGNCFFRMGKYPEARLYYFRAKKISPRQDDIDYNLKVAVEKLGVQETPESVLSVFADFFTESEFKAAATFLTWLFFALAVMWVLTKREFVLWTAAALFVIDAFAYGVLYAKMRGGPDKGFGIVMREAGMQSGPGGSYKVIASVPAGMLTGIYDEEDGWFFVRVAGSSGWIRKNALEKIE
ncbi:MAG: SH3 domain-containing protein [Elusimicrobiota bacterium]|nr:SH3 domain-containing protein [Elusimicrobiota bacterium]